MKKGKRLQQTKNKAVVFLLKKAILSEMLVLWFFLFLSLFLSDENHKFCLIWKYKQVPTSSSLYVDTLCNLAHKLVSLVRWLIGGR